MGNYIYLYIGYIVVLFIKYLIIPIIVAVLARIFADMLLNPPDRQRKNGLLKTVLNKTHI